MTTQEFLGLVEANKQLLAPELYEKLRSEASKYTEGKKQFIAAAFKRAALRFADIATAEEKIKEVLKKGIEMLKQDKKEIREKVKVMVKKAEKAEHGDEEKEAQSLLDNL